MNLTANTLAGTAKAIPVELAARGYDRQLCVDFSATVVNLMQDIHAKYGIEWRLMDVRDMESICDASVGVAFDKSTLDAMIHGSPWNPPQEVRDNVSAYLREVCDVSRLEYTVCIP